MNQNLLALLSVSALALGACGTDAGPESLRDVSIPEGFTFATTRAQTLEVSLDPAQGIPEGQLEVFTADGAALARRPIRAGAPARVSIDLPTTNPTLLVRVHGEGRVLRAHVQTDATTLAVSL